MSVPVRATMTFDGMVFTAHTHTAPPVRISGLTEKEVVAGLRNAYRALVELAVRDNTALPRKKPIQDLFAGKNYTIGGIKGSTYNFNLTNPN